MSLASGSIDLNSLKVAGEGASKYLTTINGTTGISVHDANDTDNFVNINSDGVNVYKDEDMVASFGENVRIGSYNNSYLYLTPNEIEARKADGSEYFNIGLTSNEVIKTYFGETFDKSLGQSTPLSYRFRFGNDNIWQAYNDLENGSDLEVICYVSGEYQDSSTDNYHHFSRTFSHKFNKRTGAASGTNSVTYSIAGCTMTYGYYTSQSNDYISVSFRLRDIFTYYYKVNYVYYKVRFDVNTLAPAYSFGVNTGTTKKLGFAMGVGTNPSEYGLALGKYNIDDTSDKYLLIIGNGTNDNNRSNALTVDWGGNINIAVDTTAISGDDFDLYTAISNLNWTNDVIV